MISRGNAVLAAALLLALGGAASGQEERRPAPTGYDTPAGYDLFATVAEQTRFRFVQQAFFPAGFFDKDSQPFESEILLQGAPLANFKGKQTGKADTIIARLGAAAFGPSLPSSSQIEIELVALSLASREPVKVRAGQQTQLWDVKVDLSPRRRSTGVMNVTKKNAQGGTFDSRLTVYPRLRFVRRSDGAERLLDLGEQSKGLTIQASDTPWLHRCPSGVRVVPGLNDTFCAAATEKGPVLMRHTGGDDGDDHTVQLP